MIIRNTSDIREEIENLLSYRNLKKADIARYLGLKEQGVQTKLKAKNIDLQFLTAIAELADCNLQMFFQDNKYNQKLITKKEILFNKINQLNDKQYKLIIDILDNLKEQ